MAHRYRASLESIEPVERPVVMASAVEALAEAFTLRFPPGSRFERRDVLAGSFGALEVWMGGFRGVRATVISRDPALTKIEICLVSFAPRIEERIKVIEEKFATYLRSLFWPVYLMYAAAIFPFVTARVVLAWRWRADVAAAVVALDSVWIELRGRWQGLPLLKRVRPQAMAFVYAFVLAAAAVAACVAAAVYWVEDPLWVAVLIWSAVTLGMVCIGCLAGLVMVFFGYKARF